jgi:hypothetical protein
MLPSRFLSGVPEERLALFSAITVPFDPQLCRLGAIVFFHQAQCNRGIGNAKYEASLVRTHEKACCA